MPLDIAEVTDLRTFYLEWIPTHMPSVVDANNDDFADGFGFSCADGNNRGTGHVVGAYDHIRDQYVYHDFNVKNESGGAGRSLHGGFSSVDALGRESTQGWWVPHEFDPGGPGGGDSIFPWGGNQRTRFILGQPNLENSTQTLYWYGNNTGEWSSINMSTGVADVGADAFPNVVVDALTTTVTPGIASGVAGYHNDTANTNDYNLLLFDGMTDTTDYDQETNVNAGILRGGSTHAKGLILRHAQAANFDGGSNTGRRWIWIDADTGEAVGVLGIDVNADSDSGNAFAGPSIDGRSFVWDHAQFVPDPGSSFAEPKGELHITTSNDSTFALFTQDIDHPGGSFTAEVSRQFVMVYDFNPYGNTTGTLRTHNRKIFTGIIDIPFSPAIAGGHNFPASSANASDVRSPAIYYHPPSRSYVNRQNGTDDVSFENVDMPLAGLHRLIRWRRANVIETITAPTPLDAVTENRVVRARVIAADDFNERAAGVTVGYTLFRNSTRAESFDGTATGAGTYTVEADEIDEDGHLDIRHTNDVDNAGTLLVETTDYTVNYATGVLTPVGSWPAQTIYVRYRHRDVRLTPAHGALLTASGVTDEDGVSIVQVSYADNLEGEIDEIEVSDQ